MKTLNELQTELDSLKSRLDEAKEKLEDIKGNPENYADLDTEYDEFLDEIYSEVCAALPISVSGSELIIKHDPVMYRCGFSDFCNSYESSNLDIYRETEEEVEDLENQISDVESEIEDLEQN